MNIPYAVRTRPDTGLNNARLGVWLFLASEAMLFGGLISAYVFLRVGAAPGEFGQGLEEVPLASFNTLVLLASSLTVTLSLWALREGHLERYRAMLGATVILGSIFVIIKGVDYAHKFSLGFYPASNTYYAIFYTLTGVHALHVIGGVIVAGSLWLRGGRIWKAEPDHFRSRAAATALYWNFVDGVWIVLFLLLYIL